VTTHQINGYTVSTNTPDNYRAPEERYVCLVGGVAEGRGRLNHTGWIVQLVETATGYAVQTLSGSVYALGEPREGAAAEAAEVIRAALSRLQSGPVTGYHPATLAHLLRA